MNCFLLTSLFLKFKTKSSTPWNHLFLAAVLCFALPATPPPPPRSWSLDLLLLWQDNSSISWVLTPAPTQASTLHFLLSGDYLSTWRALWHLQHYKPNSCHLLHTPAPFPNQFRVCQDAASPTGTIFHNLSQDRCTFDRPVPLPASVLLSSLLSFLGLRIPDPPHTPEPDPYSWTGEQIQIFQSSEASKVRLCRLDVRPL